jgi:hypothetical protein
MPDASTQTSPDFTSEILEELRLIRGDTHRNSVVADKYGNKADAIFEVVERIGYVLTSPFRLLASRGSPLLENEIH